ncbi:transposase [Chryseobacterium rhizoplanae]|uniref:transposase n=1 Tax=Chryseobacterium rhizoplanae TaxID=1609531 RepID=UPI001CE24C54|nr:transposase [Chryseobacterium rhizoplanae]UCA61807.1 transposase [Chryseobacterium rhizoplanae]
MNNTTTTNDDTFKKIHIGELLYKRVQELQIGEARICSFLSLSTEQVSEMYEKESIDAHYLLMWCKLLEYDFFRIYSQHLILYAPASRILDNTSSRNIGSALPQFRKNIYTKEVVDFMVELVTSKQKSIYEITKEYGIPKTTLHKWVVKYRNNKKDEEK